jgi:hypothetical protein
MNPLTRIQLPRSSWMLLDVLILVLIGWAIHVIREENAGNRPHHSLTKTVGEPPDFPFLTLFGTFQLGRRNWPALLGGTFVLALLGTQIGDGDFEDINLGNLIMQTISALMTALFAAWIIYAIANASANSGVAEKAKREQAPGDVFIIPFILVLIFLAFGGYFTPSPPYDGPDDYDPVYDSGGRF